MTCLKKSFGIIICLLAGVVLHGQVLVRASADRERILVGEPIRITVEARLPLGEKVNWFRLDTIPHFEWVDKGVPLDTNDVDGKKISQTITVTSYDTGRWTIPRFFVSVSNKQYASDTLTVDVRYSDGFNAEEDYRDIKETVEVESDEENNLKWWVIGGITLLALIAIVLMARKKKSTVAVEKPNPLTPYEEAMQELQRLKKQEQNDVKGFYTKLNDVLRTYLNRQLKVSTYEKTNEEIILQLRDEPLPKEQFTQLAQALRLSDFVKFAKYTPSASDNSEALQTIESVINTINKGIISREQIKKTN